MEGCCRVLLYCKFQGVFMKKFVLLLVSLCLSASAAQAQTVAACLREATSSHSACVSECNSDRDTAKVSCRVPEGDCGDLCKASHAGCVEPFVTQKDNCVTDCNTTLSTARTTCAAECGCTLNVNCGATTCFGECMDPPTIANATCKAVCRRSNTFRNGIRACNRVLRLCGLTCAD